MRYSVFISSRFRADDLQSKRLEIQREFHLEPSRFAVHNLDDGTAHSVSPKQRSLGELKRCHALVLLLGPSYADVAATTKSITEEEYEQAFHDGLRILAYRIGELDDYEPRARQFFDRVSRDGFIVGDYTHPARVVRQVETACRAIDEAEVEAISDGVGSSLGRRLNYVARQLGFPSEIDPAGDHQPGPTATADLLQQRRFAFHSLLLGSLDGCLDHLGRARSIYAYDWTAAFCEAWLLGIEPARADKRRWQRAAHAAFLAAGRSTDDRRYRPQRILESAVLLARAERALGSLDEATSAVEAALDIDPTSKHALTEQLLLACDREDASALDLAVELLRLHPWHCLELVRGRATASMRPLIVARLSSVMRGLIEEFGQEPDGSRGQPWELKTQVARAWESYRDDVSAAFVRDHTEAAELWMLLPSEWRPPLPFADRTDVLHAGRSISTELALRSSELDRWRAFIAEVPLLQEHRALPLDRQIAWCRDEQSKAATEAARLRTRAWNQAANFPKPSQPWTFALVGGVIAVLFFAAVADGAQGNLGGFLTAVTGFVATVALLVAVVAFGRFCLYWTADYRASLPLREADRHDHHRRQLELVEHQLRTTAWLDQRVASLRSGLQRVESLGARDVDRDVISRRVHSRYEAHWVTFGGWGQLLEPQTFHLADAASPGDLTRVVEVGPGGVPVTQGRRVISVVNGKVRGTWLGIFVMEIPGERVEAYQRWLTGPPPRPASWPPPTSSGVGAQRA